MRCARDPPPFLPPTGGGVFLRDSLPATGVLLRGRPQDPCDDDALTSRDQHDQPHQDRVQSDLQERFAGHRPAANNEPVDIQDANPADIQLDVHDLGDTQLAYSTSLYNLQAHTGQPTYVLFGGWQTEQQLGFVAAVHTNGETNVQMSTEDREGRDIQTELTDRIAQVIEHSQTHQATTPTDADRENQPAPVDLQLAQHSQPEIEHAPETQQDHEHEQDQDLSLGIE